MTYTYSEIKANVEVMLSDTIFPFEEKWHRFELNRGYIVLTATSKMFDYKFVKSVYERAGLSEHLLVLEAEYKRREKKFMAEHPDFAKSVNYIPDGSDDMSAEGKPRYGKRHGKVIRKINGRKAKPCVRHLSLNRNVSVNASRF